MKHGVYWVTVPDVIAPDSCYCYADTNMSVLLLLEYSTFQWNSFIFQAFLSSFLQSPTGTSLATQHMHSITDPCLAVMMYSRLLGFAMTKLSSVLYDDDTTLWL